MNEEITKLAKVKKSCKAGRILTKILMIISIVAVVLSLVSGIAIIAAGERFDHALLEGSRDPFYQDGGMVVPFGVRVSVKYSGDEDVVINVDDLSSPEYLADQTPASESNSLVESGAYHASRTALLITNKLTPHMLYGLYLIFISVLCLAVVIVMHLLSSTFGIIEKEESPFSKKVIKRLTAIFTVISVVLLCTLGWGAGIIMGIITWALYTILDYGRILQIQADETL
ncbi:MAG: hypothetical protein J5685_03725 [Clostridiales bacterium]|nr:hypothetical protein [Clostridiales bacterium]